MFPCATARYGLIGAVSQSFLRLHIGQQSNCDTMLQSRSSEEGRLSPDLPVKCFQEISSGDINGFPCHTLIFTGKRENKLNLLKFFVIVKQKP